MPLPLRHRAQAYNHFTINIQLRQRSFRLSRKWRIRIDNLRLAEIIRARIKRRTNPNPEISAFLASFSSLLHPLVPIDQFFSNIQHARIITRIVNASIRRGVRKLLFANVITLAHLVRREAKLVAADIHHPLEKPKMLHARVAAIRANRTLIRHNLRKIEARILETIRTGKNLRPNNATKRFVARKCPTIVDMTRLDRRNYAVFIERYARIKKRPLVAMRASQQMLGARLSPFHGAPAKFPRGQRAQRHIRIIRNLDAKSAADINTLQVNLIDPDSQRRRKKLRGESREGIIRPILDPVFFQVPLANHRIVLKRRAREAMKRHAPNFHNVSG